MKTLLTCLLAVFVFDASAQRTTRITVKASENANAVLVLTLERVRFHETLGVGLAETQLDPVGVFDLSVEKGATIPLEIDQPALVRMAISPKNTASNANPDGARDGSRTQSLYLEPGDELTIAVGNDNALTFQGKNAARQEFLQAYFLDNHYQYLPAFNFNPRKIDNAAIVQQSDSLAKLRTAKYEEFKATHPVDEAFDSFVQATTHTESYLMRAVVKDREIRRNKAMKMTAAQRGELSAITRDNFKLFPDAALLSPSYRKELREWILIPVHEKFPAAEADGQAISPPALSAAYQASDEKLRDYPKQHEYLLTYWLNYAATALPSVAEAKRLLPDFAQRYPKSEAKDYFTKIIATKEKLEKGQSAPDFTLLDKDSSAVSLSSLRGKPLAVAFAFNLKQHEPTLKLLEEAKGDSALFVYVSVAPGIPFGTWKKYVEERPHALHLYASDEEIEKLKATYAIEPRFPFMVIDAAGRIVNRWIPQEFPNNPTLQKELRSAMGR